MQRRALLGSLAGLGTAGCLRFTTADGDTTAATSRTRATGSATSDTSTASDSPPSEAPDPTTAEPRNPGKRKWSYRARASVRSPPVTDGETVYAGSDDERLYALSAEDGQVRWRTALDERPHRRPAVDAGRVFVPTQEDVHALDIETGERVWSAGIFSRPVAAPASTGGLVHVADTVGTVFGLEPEAGNQQWSYDVNGTYPNGTNGTIARGGHTVFDRTVFVVSTNAADERWVHELDARTGEELSMTQLGTVAAEHQWGFRIAVTDETFVLPGAGPEHTLCGYERSGGAQRWSIPSDVSMQFTAHGRTVYAKISPEGESGVYAIEASTGDVRWSQSGGTCCVVPPVVADDTVYAADGRTLWALDPADGAERWVVEGPEQPVVSTPVAVGGGALYFGSEDARVYGVWRTG